jgi:hypothetical protein
MSSGYVSWLEPPSNQIFSSGSNSTLISLGDERVCTELPLFRLLLILIAKLSLSRTIFFIIQSIPLQD